MAKYVPNSSKPIVNVHQEIVFARGRELNEEMDIGLPSYIVDKRIIRAIEYSNLSHVEAYVKRCPTNVERYFYFENITSSHPLVSNIVISNLLGFALLHRSIEMIKMLIDMGSKPFQTAYFIDWSLQTNGAHKLIIHSAPTCILLAGSIQHDTRAAAVDVISAFREREIDFQIPVEVKRQQLEQPNPPITNVTRCIDLWECLDKEMDKAPGDVQSNLKEFLKELKSVYRVNKLDKMKVN